MLSAVRAMAARVAHDLAHMDTRRLGPDATAQEQDELLAEVLENALEAGKEAVERGPEQLAILRESGRRRRRRLRPHRDPRRLPGRRCAAPRRPQLEHQYAPAALHRPEHESSSFRYCTNFAVTGESLEAGRFTALLEDIGDSVLVVGDDRTLRVHVHTDEPDRAVALFDTVGEVSRFDVADMHEQVAERSARLAGEGAAADLETCAVVAVASGPGVKRLYEELGVLVVDGGATMNPSTYELLAGIHAAPGRRGAGAAQQPQRDPGRRARGGAVREARARGADHRAAGGPGRAARLRPRRRAATPTRRSCTRPPRRCAWAGWRPAARDDAQGRFTAGDAVGYAGGELVAWGDPAETLAATLAQIAEGAELLTCIAGRAAAARPRRGGGARPRGRGGGVPRGRAARVVVAALRGVNRFASKEPLPDDAAGPLLPQAQPARRADRRPQGAGAARHRHLGRPDRAPAARPPRPPRRAAGRRAGGGGGGDRRGGRPRRDRQADARPAPQARRGARVRRERPARGGLVQPALDRPPARRGVAGAAARQAAPAGRVLGDRVRAVRRRRRRPAGSHGRAGAGPPRDRGDQRRQAARADVAGLPAHARLGRAAADGAARGRGAARPPGRARRRPLPRPRGGRAGRPAPARLRGAVPAPARGGGAAARPPRGARARGRSRRAASWSTAGAGRCRSS